MSQKNAIIIAIMSVVLLFAHFVDPIHGLIVVKSTNCQKTIYGEIITYYLYFAFIFLWPSLVHHICTKQEFFNTSVWPRLKLFAVLIQVAFCFFIIPKDFYSVNCEESILTPYGEVFAVFLTLMCFPLSVIFGTPALLNIVSNFINKK